MPVLHEPNLGTNCAIPRNQSTNHSTTQLGDAPPAKRNLHNCAPKYPLPPGKPPPLHAPRTTLKPPLTSPRQEIATSKPWRPQNARNTTSETSSNLSSPPRPDNPQPPPPGPVPRTPHPPPPLLPIPR
ncbi:hypothetical protein KC19_1G060900 [Ceratodon purpureus]|uniref:Uncharacterized protein n=1 Tax=Ceratodon purpureus TaxID=3225 RepID=A0A8T0J355_CERPU|nr:hypothetical protein KC19_1G060900 [Ceratodon purpureus]